MSKLVETLLERIPVGAHAGMKRTIRNTLADVTLVRGTVEAAAKNPADTPYGATTRVILPFMKKTIVPALRKAQRMVDYSKKELDRTKAAVKKRAIGEPKSTDTAWANRMYEMSPTERVTLIKVNPAARAVALREPELCGFSPADYPNIEAKQVAVWLDEALQLTIRQNFEKDAARIEVQEMAHELLQVSAKELEKAAVETPVITDAANGVFKFANPSHLQHWIDANVPGEVGTATPQEQAVFDSTEEFD